MTLRTFVSMTLIASLLLAAAPITARAADGPKPVPSLRASMDRAVAEAVAAQKTFPAVKAVRSRASAAAAAQAGGGGGGKGMMVMTLLGTAAGLAGTYFLVKEMRKQNDAKTAQ
jgi:hypothetical protein